VPTGLSAALLEVLFIAGMVLFGAGFLWRVRKDRGLLQDNHKHLFRAAAWIAFGLYWFALFPGYAIEEDLINALGAAVALPIFLFLAYHEHLSWKWREEYEPLRFLCGAAFIASAIYFAFDRIIPLSAAYIDLVADHTVWMLGLIGQNYAVGPVDLVGNLGFYRSNAEELYAPILDPAAQTDVVNIVLACTAIQAIAVAAALIFSTRDDPRRKLLATAVIFPVTYVMNLVRNTVVIHYYYTAGQDFDIVHSGYGKGLSLLVTAILLLLAFYLLPELYVVLNGLYDLPWRKAPGWDYRKNVGTLFRKSRERSRDKEGGAPPPVKGPAE